MGSFEEPRKRAAELRRQARYVEDRALAATLRRLADVYQRLNPEADDGSAYAPFAFAVETRRRAVGALVLIACSASVR